jgi:hypothetical protein
VVVGDPFQSLRHRLEDLRALVGGRGEEGSENQELPHIWETLGACATQSVAG